MATTTTATLETLIEDTLSILYRLTERPYQVTVGSNALADGTDTTLTVSDGARLQTTDVVELGSELCLVTAKSSDATPVFTVARGYAGTTATSSGFPTSTVALINPPWPRNDVSTYLQRAVKSLMNSYLPYLVSTVYNRAAGLQYIELPATTVKVLSVRHVVTSTGRMVDIGGWQFEEDLPTAVVASTKLLRVPSTIDDDDDLIVTTQSPYSWTGSGEAATVPLPLGAEDIPPLWAAAYAVTRREVTRSDIDKIEEWNQDAAMRQGVNLRWARELWGEVYRRLDEAKRMQYVPRHRPYRKMPNIL